MVLEGSAWVHTAVVRMFGPNRFAGPPLLHNSHTPTQPPTTCSNYSSKPAWDLGPKEARIQLIFYVHSNGYPYIHFGGPGRPEG